jgi:hypothetical protein
MWRSEASVLKQSTGENWLSGEVSIIVFQDAVASRETRRPRSGHGRPRLMRAGSVPKQKGEKYYTILKAKGEDQEARHVLLIVLAKHDEVRPRAYGQGFAASEFNRTGHFVFKGDKLLTDATTRACAAAEFFWGGATPQEINVDRGNLHP